jgi:glucokinase
MTHIVFDVGGTNVRVARVLNGVPTDVRKEKTANAPADVVAQIAEASRELAGNEPITAAAGGVAGIIAADGVVHHSPNLPGWDAYPFGPALREQLGAPVDVRNDADLAGLGEALYGAGKEASIMAYVSVGTGVGGSRICNGRIDPHTFGFEPGHQIVDVANGRTLESLVSGGALQSQHGIHPKELPRDVWEDLTPILAAGLYNTCVYWSPVALVLGGSVLLDPNSFQLDLLARELEKLNRGLFPHLPELRRGTLGDHAGLYGAASLL